MADMTPLTDILNGDAADATDVQGNFQTIETYINGTDLVRTDGTEVMTADLDLDGNTLANISGLDMNATKITDLATATAVTDAAAWGQVTAGNYEVTSGGVVVGTGGTTVDTIEITVPTAGLARIYSYGTVTAAGVSGFGEVSIIVTVTGGIQTASNSQQLVSNTTSGAFHCESVVPLSAGLNTFTVVGTRGDTGTSGGTLTVDTGFRTGIMGMF